MVLDIDLNKNTENKIKIILGNSKNKGVLFEEFVEYRINEIKKAIVNLKRDLIKYEKKHNMSSAEFYNKQKIGKILIS